MEQTRVKNCECIDIFYDNSSSIKLSKNPVMHRRTKHIDIRYHYLRDLSSQGVIKLVFYGTQEQVSNIMIKPMKLD
uniref:Copia protein n=1 Tax=Cajanus cajan TaxID=3821 RepID=A0A151SVS7_CAJCA|nr:Copia protein [Cajanus cajan]